MSLVIDASVAIKWVVPETGTAAALALRRQQLFAPDLLIAECANVLWKKVRRNELSEVEALLAARLIERADIELRPMRPLLELATQLAIRLDHSAYDCIYLALAEETSGEFVTADASLHRKVAATQFAERIRLLDTAA
ncbi:MAG: type II toxin-antitoxin system VapC family toxin [Alphaproteobacteria bacterium]|nr:type II toxin-antitoxin system VapC family toxin [Alphaproteobacteria bacterium]